MRRLMVSTILCCTLLWACAASGSDDKGKENSQSEVSTGSSVTKSAVTVNGEVIIHETEPAADHGGRVREDDVKRAEVQTVTDETGKKRKLKLEI